MQHSFYLNTPMRKIFATLAFAVLSLLPARAAVTNVEATVTFTNQITSRGATTNGDTITINGSLRRYTNGVLNNPALWILSTNVLGHAATNTVIHFNTYGSGLGIDYISWHNGAATPTYFTNAFRVVSLIGSNLTVTLSSGVGTVSYTTNSWDQYRPVSHPAGSLPTAAARTNNQSGLFSVMGDAYATNVVPNSVPGLTNLLDRISYQEATNKTLRSTTNYGGLSDGTRITNFTGLSGSNGTIADINIQRGGALNLTNLSGTNVALTNIVLRHVQFIDANPRGTNVGFTNGFTSAITNINPIFSNGINFGSALRSEGSGGNSFQMGSNALATGANSVAVGNNSKASNSLSIAIGESALATNDYATAIGQGATAGGTYSIAVGQEALTVGSYSLAIGQAAKATNGYSTAVGNLARAGFDGTAAGFASFAETYGTAYGGTASANAIYAGAFGTGTSSDYSNSVAIGTRDHLGTATATTTTNQIRLGTANHVVSAPGFIQGTVSNLVTASGQTNVLAGDLSTPRAAVTTIANGANRFSMGTNVFIDLTGTPSAAGWSVDGIIFGAVAPRDGHTIKVRNGTGYDATFVHNSGLEAVAAYRISTATSTNVIFTNAATAEFIYSASASRWLLWNVFSGHTLTASATNAIGYLDGSGTNLNLYQTAANVALTINPLIGAGGHRLAIKDTNGNAVIFVNTNNLLIASNAEFRGDVYAKTLTVSNGTSTSTARVGGTIFVQTNVVGLTNKGFTSLLNGIGTTNFPANFFEVGRPVIFEVEGAVFSSGGATWTNQVRLNGSMVASNLAGGNIWDTAEVKWGCRVRITPIATGASGALRITGWFDGVMLDPNLNADINGYSWLPYSTLISADTTAAISFGVHSASSTANAGTDYIRVTGGIIKVE